MGIIHFYMSGKGGIGKTLEALCTSLYYLQEVGNDVLICDFNFFNADLFQIIRKLKDNVPVEHKKGFNIYHITSFNANARLIFPTELYRIPDQLPIGFFEMVRNAISLDLGDFNPEICIIDTGFHIGNMKYNYDDIDKINSDQFKEIVEIVLDKYEPFFWFTWTLAALKREEEKKCIKETIKSLEKLENTGKEPWFNHANNLIHVINPHALVSPVSWYRILQDFKKIFKLELPDKIEIEDLYELYKKPVLGNVSLDFIYDKVAKRVIQAGKKKSEIAETIRIEQLSKFVEPILERKKGYRPYNVFPIPYYFDKLSGYTDTLALKDIYSLEDIITCLGDAYYVLHNMISKLQK